MLQFGPGSTSFTISLPIIDDDTSELTENFQASLSFVGAAPPRMSIDPGVATITILDDDGKFCISSSLSDKDKPNLAEFCPTDMYVVTNADGSTVCRDCPANSISSSINSPFCGCIPGYYRNQLEDIHVDCTRKDYDDIHYSLHHFLRRQSS